MDPIALTVMFKGIGMILAIGGGIWIARFGFQLYKDGAGLGRDKAAIEFGKIRITANSVGSVVMCTAFLWAYLGVLLSPKYEKKGDVIRVYSMATPAGEVEAPAIQTQSPASVAAILDLEQLTKLFNKKLAESNQGGLLPFVTLAGKQATVHPGKDQPFQSDKGDFVFSTDVVAEGKKAELRYTAKSDKGMVVFIPSGSNQKEGKP